MNAPFIKLIETDHNWSDLALEQENLQGLTEIRDWLRSGKTLMNERGLNKKIKRGYRALFCGKAGTRKTLAAGLLGKDAGLDVYRIDLSMVLSKYIGETEKQLARIFDEAETKKSILFFDEADALFGKRTDVKDAHDRYANQEISYLLQRIEDYPGVVIVATNMKSNIDDAFIRRFQAVIDFGMPKGE
ncbi:MAG: ATP-binding protein [Bacteroidota bacterium]